MENGLDKRFSQASAAAQLVRGIGIKELVTRESAKALSVNNISVAPPGTSASGVYTQANKADRNSKFTIDDADVRYEAHMLEDGTVCIDACITESEAVVFPDEIDGCAVTVLAPHVCSHAQKLTSVVLPRHTRDLGAHAFDRCLHLEAVGLSQDLVSIGGFAFSNTQISTFVAPPTLRDLGMKAFFHCANLKTVTLNDGLTSIGEGAFCGTKIESVRVPGSVVKMGREVFRQTPLVDEGLFGALSFGVDSPFVADVQGGLYRKATKGLVLVEMLGLSVENYIVLPGTIRIADRAFLYHPSLVSLVLPEGLQSIGNASFKYCRSLKYVVVPDSLTTIGEEAFRSTALANFRIPAGFRYLGMYGLSTCSRGSSLAQPTLRDLEVDPENETFYMESGILCRRDDEGDHAVVFVGPQTDVTIPKSVIYIDGFCFGGVDSITHLTVHTDILGVGLGAFFISAVVPRVTIVTKDIHGVEHRYEAYFPSSHFPSSSYSGQCFSQAFGGPTTAGAGDEDLVPRGKTPDGIVKKSTSIMDPATIFAFADLSIRHCYQTIERTGLILLRLSDGRFLDESGRDMFVKSVERHLEEFVIACSRQNDIQFIKMLVDLGFINEQNIARIIDLLGAQKDVKLVSYLLNEQHERFSMKRGVVEDL
ncbi:MAG: leucine-rich repeat domain-containing protein [Eggerthellaceae bacterium]|nr:leucine-rich repeat domain-containing protein [Eggerthellaceae bacterium]